MNNILHDEIFKMSEDKEMSIKVLEEFRAKHKRLITERYKKLNDAYIGDHEILTQKKKPNYKPDNRIVVNYPKYLVDTMNGFFIGEAIKIKCDDKEISEFVNMIEKYNDQDDSNAELSRLVSIFGKAYEYYFTDGTFPVYITYCDPMEGFMIYDDTVFQKPLFFIYEYKDSDKKIHGTIYGKTHYIEYNNVNGDMRFIDDWKPHGFNDVPATEYIENENRMGLFEPVLSIVNAYNKVISEKANDVDYFADAYLKILGAKLNDGDEEHIRSNRIINFEGEDSENLIVEFMDKPNSDTTQENLIERLERLIFQISMVANIADENFGTTSGIALQFKLLSMRNLAKTKERKFTSGLNRRYKVIFSSPTNKFNNEDWIKLSFKFTQNVPANLLDEAQVASQLNGMVSKETQLQVLSCVEDVQEEIERIRKDMDEKEYETDFPTNRTGDDLDE